MSTEEESDQPAFGRTFRVSHTYRSIIYRAGLYGSVATLLLILAFPLYWMAQSAFTTREGIQDGITFLPTPETFTVEQFDIVFNPTVGRYLLNSIIVTTGVVITVIVVSLIAGYGLARFDYKHKVKVARFLLVGYMFSPIVIAIPLYLIWDYLGLLNRYVGLIIALSALSMPFAVWLMWKYIQTIPTSLEESAWVAGASRWQGFKDVIVPQTKPAMIANSVFAFAIAWGDFTISYILMPSNEATTFPPGIFRVFTSSWETGWAEFMAISLLVSLPALLFAFFLQSYLLKGFKIRAL
ncbi:MULTISPECIES: carbohydrate ABC transporter permease [Natronorubrum]|uniref:Carbohydrate ABC transporter membrane protein 2, CUT1 family n=1 Tax=Natronorubrum texcoconense TaxID=1095776 RepID=A0A1G8VBC7_9EURY|nr:carbohydrate ABC transporter permease [Natronorubrum texcoconense]SDJ63381.1 carbohydrate ABC transporter membrane protein 2, CUT1 family [Natronorubrum texcoconense]